MENLDCALAHLGKELVHQTGGEERHGLRPGIYRMAGVLVKTGLSQ